MALDYGMMEVESKKPVKTGSMDFLEDVRVQEYNGLLLSALTNKRRMTLGPLDFVEKEVEEYFQVCMRDAQIPSIKALGLYIGVPYSVLKKEMMDVTSVYYPLLSYASDMCHTMLESLALNNKVNPATYMFTAANYYGMKNTQSVEINKNVQASSGELEGASDVMDALKSLVKDPVVRKVVKKDVEDAEVKEV